MSERAVRQALRADLDEGAATLAAAFAGDPWFGWLYPGPATFAANATAWFTLVLDLAFGKGHTDHAHVKLPRPAH